MLYGYSFERPPAFRALSTVCYLKCLKFHVYSIPAFYRIDRQLDFEGDINVAVALSSFYEYLNIYRKGKEEKVEKICIIWK